MIIRDSVILFQHQNFAVIEINKEDSQYAVGNISATGNSGEFKFTIICSIAGYGEKAYKYGEYISYYLAENLPAKF